MILYLLNYFDLCALYVFKLLFDLPIKNSKDLIVLTLGKLVPIPYPHPGLPPVPSEVKAEVEPAAALKDPVVQAAKWNA